MNPIFCFSKLCRKMATDERKRCGFHSGNLLNICVKSWPFNYGTSEPFSNKIGPFTLQHDQSCQFQCFSL